nr:AMP-binding protein [Cronobacter dublinensis]
MPVSPYWAYQAAALQTRDYAPGELFAYGVALHPDKLAINDGKRHYTFAQLEAMATRLAHWLAAQGVSAGGRVPVLSEKHALMPVIAAACWKLGAVYVPLDGQLPENRCASCWRGFPGASCLRSAARRWPTPAPGLAARR